MPAPPGEGTERAAPPRGLTMRATPPAGNVTTALLAPLLRGEGSRPRLTQYSAGNRTELSTASLANWSAKVAGLLLDELGSRPGDLVYVGSPAGWQTAAVLLGTWWAGLVVTDVDSPNAAAAFVPDGADPADGAAEEVFVVSGHPLGAPSRTVAAHQRDFTTAVLPQADRFSPRGPVPHTARAVSTDRAEWSVADLLELVDAQASALSPGDRLLSNLPWTLPGGLVGTLLAALAVDGSLVQSDGSPGSLAGQALAEKATVTAGFAVAGLRRTGA